MCLVAEAGKALGVKELSEPLNAAQSGIDLVRGKQDQQSIGAATAEQDQASQKSLLAQGSTKSKDPATGSPIVS